jgi:hypothetical protein
MSLADLRRGAAPVGMVTDLPPLEAGAVRYLRLWCGDKPSRDRVALDFAAALGPAAGAHACSTLAGLCDLCARYGRRPLMRHSQDCRCLGADESCLAHLVASAAEGSRDDAMLLASLLVRADMAMGLATLAEELGLSLKRMSLLPRRPVPEMADAGTHLD